MPSFLRRGFLCLWVASIGLAPVVRSATAPVPRPTLVMLIAENEYETAKTLPTFAAQQLARDFTVIAVQGSTAAGANTFESVAAVADADLLLVSVRRRPLPPAQLEAIRRHVAAGKPVVGIRTASHAFSPVANQPLAEGLAQWPEFDAAVLGGNYRGHHGKGSVVRITAASAAHPILRGVPATFESEAWLYRNSPLQPGATVLLRGEIEGQPAEPLAWTFTRPEGGRSFYTSLGMPSDFQNAAFVQLLRNGIYWAAGVMAAPASAAVETQGNALAGEPPLRTPDDLALDLVAREPVAAQPVFLNFDERGRMWVVQYLQYPEPAGLTPLARDSVWRIRYDRKKPAPPYDTPEKAAFRGRDRIVILEDVKGDGSFAKVTPFVDGLNITSAVCRGRGGVWVLSPPQLLWYPDANNDDVPDGAPQVALDGFGIEDTHSIANSLRWGPDGWLYGAVGSTVVGDIVRPGLDAAPIAHMVGQGIWRYHPETRRFEVFAEGGGNAFGVEIDAKGRIFSGHNGGDTRGFHYVQGSYLRKGFDKHGELSNPYAFGYFPAMRHEKVNRFTHNFIIYEGAALPERYRGKLVGIDPMNNYLPLAELRPRGATFETHDIDALVRTEDRNFRPVDIKHGPDGAIYVADWRDFQINHYRNHEGQLTREDGRIYRLRARDTQPGYAPFDLQKKTTPELIALLRHENRWWRETALQVLGERRDPAAIAPLKVELARNEPGQFALESLWALNLSGGFDEAVARTLFTHRDPHVRAWAVRLVGDTEKADLETARALVERARVEPDVEVRSQLAASAKRWPAAVALPVVKALLARSEDLDDAYLPLQLWWAIERACGSDRAAVLALFAPGQEESPWRYPMVLAHLAPRLMRRFAAAGGTDNLLACAQLLTLAPTAETRRALVQGFEQAFEGRSLPVLPEPLVEALVNSGSASLSLRMRRKDPAAIAEGLRRMVDPRAAQAERVRVIATFGEVPDPAAAERLAALLTDGKREIVRAALAASSAYREPALLRAIVTNYARFHPEEQTLALAVMTTRPEAAAALIDAIEAGHVARETVSAEMRERVRLVADAALMMRVDRLFGASSTATAGALDQEIGRVTTLVRDATGNLYAGRTLFEQRCASCHRFFNQGGQIGPDLTSFKRDDVASLVLAIVNPNAEMREGYEPFVLTKKDGTVLSGFVAAQDERQVTIRDMAGLSATVPRGEIAALHGMGTSLMPTGLLSGLSDQQIRDLLAFLRITQPLVGKE